jgi:F-type H+-transporting ATPase subunit alpha
LNQGEREPLAVEDQVLQVFAATNGFLDRITVPRVGEFLQDLIEHAHAHHKDLRKKIAAGEWSDEIQEQVRKAIGDFAEGFGFDLDEEGQPLDPDAPPEAAPAKKSRAKRATKAAKAPKEEGAPA